MMTIYSISVKHPLKSGGEKNIYEMFQGDSGRIPWSYPDYELWILSLLHMRIDKTLWVT